jgi:hypothetical protein
MPITTEGAREGFAIRLEGKQADNKAHSSTQFVAGRLWHCIDASGFDVLRLHHPLGSGHGLDEVSGGGFISGGKNPGDTIGPTLPLSMRRLKTNKLTDMERRLHGLLLEAKAGLALRRNRTHSEPFTLKVSASKDSAGHQFQL